MNAENGTWRQDTMMDKDFGTREEMMGKTIVCDVSPHVMMNSYGLLEKMASGSKGMEFWEYPLPQLEIIIFSTFILWRFFDILFKKLGVPIPKFTSMMLVGAVLSEVFESVEMSWFEHIFVHDSTFKPNVAENIGAFAFVLNWFLRGVTTDIGMVKKSGTKGVIIGITTMIIPWQTGKILYLSRKKSKILTMTLREYNIMTFTMSMTPFTCVNLFLTDLKIVNTEFGQIAQSSGMVTDILAFALTIWNFINRDENTKLQKGFSMVMFFIFLFLVRKFMLWVIKHTPEGSSVKNTYLYIGLFLAYLSYLFWSHFLFFGPLGAFVLGLAIPNGPPLGSVFIQKFDSFNEGIFLPLFGTLSMIKLDWSFIQKELSGGTGKHLLDRHIYDCFTFLLILYIAKFSTSFLVSVAAKIPWRDSLILGLIMGTKSSFELAYVLLAFEQYKISMEFFTLMGVYILVNSLITPMAIHFFYDRSKRFICYRGRNLKHKSELHMLVCINKPDNITSMISLLRATSPSKDSPVKCCVLHLIELLGQANPTFISHQIQKPKPGHRSYSQNVLSSFQLFQEMYWRDSTTSIDIFTSLTSVKEMHEHVPWFALDKGSNLILLSFHLTWEANGDCIISDDQNLRSLNLSLLKRAPCSVGIFVHRKPIWQPKSVDSPCRVCLIYVDGNDDDKEALALANHMRGNKQVSLTVMHLIPASSKRSLSERIDMDRSIEIITRDNNSSIIDLKVMDGTETSKILHSVAWEYDLFLVGRRSGVGTIITKGLGDWMEFEELGVIGDLLASEYFPSRASVLIVQQQD